MERRLIPAESRIRQTSGFAMIALITMVALISSYLLANVLTRTSTEVRLDNDVRTQQAMREAKAALISYAASQAWTGSSANDQPGSLPCPSSDEDGLAMGTCASEALRLGRLPWKTIGAQKLYDGSGNVLWYALSSEFRKLAGTTIINSDTSGSLTITGATPATKVVAVIIAPGVAVSGQVRPSALTGTVDNYLESSNANTSDTDTFVTATGSSDTFNDNLITITQAELMAVVEPAVAARLERDIKPYLTTYASQWGGYPFPATFPKNSSAQSAYSGDNSVQYGLLPITASLTYPWVSGTGAVAITGGTAGGVTVTSCTTTSSPSGWKCLFTINAINLGTGYTALDTCKNPSNGTRYRYCIVNPAFSVAGDVSNAGLSLAQINPTTATDVTVTNTGGTTARPMSSKSIAASLKSSGMGTVTFSGTYTYSSYNTNSFTRAMAVFIPDRVNVSPMTSSTDSTAGWFIQQQWYRQTYYAVAPGYLPAGGSSCTAGTTCLTVNDLPSSYSTKNDKRAILVLMGRALTGSRPSSTLTDYLEGENATPADHVFVHKTGTPTSINDRVVVLAP
jgi:hypothetical protein